MNRLFGKDEYVTLEEAEARIHISVAWQQLADTMRDNQRLRKALEFADSVIYSEFCTGRNPDGSDRIPLDGYDIIKEALSNKDSA